MLSWFGDRGAQPLPTALPTGVALPIGNKRDPAGVPSRGLRFQGVASSAPPLGSGRFRRQSRRGDAAETFTDRIRPVAIPALTDRTLRFSASAASGIERARFAPLTGCAGSCDLAIEHLQGLAKAVRGHAPLCGVRSAHQGKSDAGS